MFSVLDSVRVVHYDLRCGGIQRTTRMVMVKKEDMPPCPVATTVTLIASKWKLLILRNLLTRPWRFNELGRELSGISQKTLTACLRSMEDDGLVVRRVLSLKPPHVEYSLTPLGQSMRSIIAAMEAWGLEYQKAMQTPSRQ